MPCKSTITPSEVLIPREIPIGYWENFVRLRYQSENIAHFRSIGRAQPHPHRALTLKSIERLEHDIAKHFEDVRKKNEMFGVYDV
ncbi:hypothetical protein TWF730_001700 [Orbilia blumenaviensis]|uniref:Uncharacterized protein n=1 Tax=Orbilia blumenaviensis TaxID=1796055 RepID=A0AAV9UKL1_9PEZI